MHKVLLLDRSRIFAEALAARIDREADMSVVATPTSVASGCQVLASTAANIAVCDDILAEDLITGAQQRPGSRPPCVVVIAEAGCYENATRLVQVGIAGWVTRDQPVEHLLATIRGAARGETWIPPSLLTRVLRELTAARQEARESEQRLTGLTSREREILMLLGQGLGRQEVAARLHLSQHTVRTHLQNIRTGLAVHSTLAAVAVARAERSSAVAAS